MKPDAVWLRCHRDVLNERSRCAIEDREAERWAPVGNEQELAGGVEGDAVDEVCRRNRRERGERRQSPVDLVECAVRPNVYEVAGRGLDCDAECVARWSKRPTGLGAGVFIEPDDPQIRVRVKAADTVRQAAAGITGTDGLRVQRCSRWRDGVN